MIPSNLSIYKRWLVVVSVPDLLDRQTDTHNTHTPTHTHTHTHTHASQSQTQTQIQAS